MRPSLLANMILQHPSPDAIPYPSPAYFKDHPTGHLYLHQQRTVEVIQLIEVPPPPPRSRAYAFTISSDSFSSSSYSSSTPDSEVDSLCSSYCSSEEELDSGRVSFPDDTYKTRLTRVLAWREGFAKAMGASLAAPPSPLPSSLKRKGDGADDDSEDDVASHSSKRSRSNPAERKTSPQRRLSAHSCPACDASFSTRRSLQEHGKDPRLNDACRAAVEYGLES